MIILISGKMGSGKTTTAESLYFALTKQGYNVLRHRFASVIYEMHDAVLRILANYGVRRDIVKDGPLLQLLGTEWGRNTIDQDVWVKCAHNVCDEWLTPVFPAKTRNVVIIDDMRFKNELVGFPACLRVRLECDRDIRKSRCSSWRENELHPSEIDLDDWLDKFDLVLDTGKISTDQVVERICEVIPK